MAIRPLAPYRAAVSALGHYPYHHEYGRDHSDRGRPRLRTAEIKSAWRRESVSARARRAIGGQAVSVMAITIARLARAETLSLRQADFISAVRLQGASSARVLWRHIDNHVLQPRS
jgi:hypothetical protein